MKYKATVDIKDKHFKAYPREFYSDAIRDAVQLLLGYDGLKSKDARAVIHVQNPEGRWSPYSILKIDELAADAKVIASGGTPTPGPDHDEGVQKVWDQMREWFTRAGSPWRVI
jgi:hypothetical protein